MTFWSSIHATTLASLRDDPRWQELLDQLGLADDQLSLIPFEVPDDPD